MCALDEWSDEKSCVKENISLREKIRYHRLNRLNFFEFFEIEIIFGIDG